MLIINKINGAKIQETKLIEKKATIHDLESLFNLQVETEKNEPKDSLGNPLFAAEPKSMIQASLESKGSEVCVCYYKNALACYYEFCIPKSPKELEIFPLKKYIPNIDYSKIAIARSMIVSKSFRGNKLQIQILKEIEKKCLDLGFEYIFSTVHKENIYSYKNFINAGYQDLTKEKPFKLIYGERLLMIKKIK